MKTVCKMLVASSLIALPVPTVSTVAFAADNCSCVQSAGLADGSVGNLSVVSGSATVTGSQGPVSVKPGQSALLSVGSEITTGRDTVVSVNLGSCASALKADSIATVQSFTKGSDICLKLANTSASLDTGAYSYGADLVLSDQVANDPAPVADVPSVPNTNLIGGIIALAAIGGIIAFAVSNDSDSD